MMGVLQGDTLAPFLFVIALDYAMRKAIEGKEEDFGFTITPQQSRRVRAKTITDLDFADDIPLIKPYRAGKTTPISCRERVQRSGIIHQRKENKIYDV